MSWQRFSASSVSPSFDSSLLCFCTLFTPLLCVYALFFLLHLPSFLCIVLPCRVGIRLSELMRNVSHKGLLVNRRPRLHIRYQFRRFYERLATSRRRRRGTRRSSDKYKKSSSAFGVLPAVMLISSSNSNNLPMPRKNADERPLYWSTDAEGFLLERLYEYHCANHGKQPESRHYNQWAIQMATYFDGYVPAGERLKEKRRRLSKVYAVFKMLQDHTGVGWYSINNTFTCSEDLRKDLSKRNQEVNTIFSIGWKLNDMHLAAIFPSRVVATGARSYHPTMEQEHVFPRMKLELGMRNHKTNKILCTKTVMMMARMLTLAAALNVNEGKMQPTLPRLHVRFGRGRQGHANPMTIRERSCLKRCWTCAMICGKIFDQPKRAFRVTTLSMEEVKQV